LQGANSPLKTADTVYGQQQWSIQYKPQITVHKLNCTCIEER